ncbi:hypothetical protein O5O45_31515 [Hahella aquimaris]|uniref:DUF6933 domain-containing protein n=1 Tax=Hahella sp. HNIBRBA332 TaxID=3015983 RepID=UPI00273C5BAF|nr:hypothetical protein [Hahella sp. HNIBRBA332]WLQ14249.1 hypothetical protein O5O45_31515 [Hahella sp. HNIBRBA332]
MIRLHCTKKLLAKLPLNESGTLPNQECTATESPLSGWHANLIILQRRQCVLFVHDATRFPLFAPSLKKADFARLDWHFTDVFMNTLLKVGASEQALENAQRFLAPLVCDSVCNRSVQGTMNQMTQDLENRLWFDRSSVEDLLPYSTSAWLTERPCNVKGMKDCIWPTKAMLSLLEKAT